ncbi:hypothetical protein GDO86_006595 [Hymenochirus boettgeri]|uniref:Uncharacterized protein n=1 Tax=Hymenochirus boettgeri TaxID=247094 RepID=A0A8T2JEN1_9PIPI|nr:hypothetical protein GDO86_006595 [Hymenochirus boettgeri]
MHLGVELHILFHHEHQSILHYPKVIRGAVCTFRGLFTESHKPNFSFLKWIQYRACGSFLQYILKGIFTLKKRTFKIDTTRSHCYKAFSDF